MIRRSYSASGKARSVSVETLPLLPVMSASDVARIGYQGLKAGRGVVITGLVNKIMATSSRLSPTPVSLRIANWMMSAGK